jgi:Lytic polysaccharide mono-oxygenase, cellulose-degrading
MRSHPLSSSMLLLVAASQIGSNAFAHIKMMYPPDAIETNDQGDPQKGSPCSSGTASGRVTTFTVGDKVKVMWKDTIFHPGHFRISIAKDRADLFIPKTTVTSNDCKSAEIERAPKYPVLLDGIEEGHMTSGSYEREITIPNMPCDKCTLQLTQFMQKHAPDCYYYHCADIKIVAKPAGADAGVNPPTPDAGTQPTVDAGTPKPMPQADGGGTTPPQPKPDAAIISADGGTGTNPKDPGGCQVSFGLFGAAALIPLLLRRRRQ